MAKRTQKEKASDPGANPRPFQIPEVTPAPPGPWEQVAATAPRLPDLSGPTPSSPPTAHKVKPTLPTGVQDFRDDEVEREKPNLLSPLMTLRRPAMSQLTTLGTELLGDCAMANALGTRDPIKALVTFSDDKKWLFFMPVGPKANNAVDITYSKKLASINFWKPFQKSGKVVQKGYKEYYALEMTEEPIVILGVKGFALYCSLEHFQEEAIQRREPSTTAGKSSRRRISPQRTAGTTTPTVTAQGAAEAADATPSDPAVEADLPELSAGDRAYETMLDERDAKIKELEKQLKAFKKQHGDL